MPKPPLKLKTRTSYICNGRDSKFRRISKFIKRSPLAEETAAAKAAASGPEEHRSSKERK